MNTVELKHGTCTVSPEDVDLLQKKWTSVKINNNYYATRYSGIPLLSTVVAMHRVILSRELDRELGPDELVDHVDRNTLNNQRSNLRMADKEQNARNRGPQKNNGSGYKGVSWSKASSKWKATIFVDGRQKHLGFFDTPEDAARAYNDAAKEHHKEFAYLNDV